MKKVLITATVVRAHISVFHLPVLKMFKEMGYETTVAARNDYENPDDCQIPYCDHYYDIPFERSPLNPGNIKAYKKLKRIIDNNNYDIIYCHTPVGGVLTRFAAKKHRKNGTKVIYTAHGFHFYKGAPLKNWLIYYPVEKICAHFTDVLITINKEDYILAQNKMKAKCVEYVPGVGIDLAKFGNVKIDRSEKRKELGIPENSILLLSVGEINENKNHETVISAIADMNVNYIIAGKGELQQHLENVIDNIKSGNYVKLLGYRSDVNELYKIADAFVFPSFREGLSLSVMEAMASGLPVICSNIRGNTDLIDNSGGALFNPHSIEDCKNAISRVLNSDMNSYGLYNKAKIKAFSIEEVHKEMHRIFFADTSNQ